MESSISKNNDRVEIVLQGRLIIESAEQCKAVLQQALDNGSNLRLDLSGVEEVDLSCLQLFCSTHKFLLHSGRQLTIAGAHDAFYRTAAAAGFCRRKGCGKDAQGACVLIQEDQK